jgi:hypothetical protein
MPLNLNRYLKHLAKKDTFTINAIIWNYFIITESFTAAYYNLKLILWLTALQKYDQHSLF